MTFIPGCSSENTSSSSSLQDSHPKWPTTIIIITLLAKDQRCDRATVEVNINFAQQKICCYCGLVNKGTFYNYVDKKYWVSKWSAQTLQRRLNPVLCVLQTYFRISLQPILIYIYFFIIFFLCYLALYCNFLERILEYL